MIFFWIFLHILSHFKLQDNCKDPQTARPCEFFFNHEVRYEAQHEVRLYSCRYTKLYVVHIGCLGDARRILKPH
jgi:hypothetical protein